MSNAIQTLSWFAQGFIGKIPVWNTAGREIGWRKAYNDYTINFYNVADKPTATTNFVSKDFSGADITLTVTVAKADGTDRPASLVVSPPNNLGVQPASSANPINALATPLSNDPNNPLSKIPVWMVAGGAGLIVYLVLTRRK